MHELLTLWSRPGKADESEKMKIHNPYTPLVHSAEDACAPDVRTSNASYVRTGMGTMPAGPGVTISRKRGVAIWGPSPSKCTTQYVSWTSVSCVTLRVGLRKVDNTMGLQPYAPESLLP